jgi:release factor H-coupled RctB family protein
MKTNTPTLQYSNSPAPPVCLFASGKTCVQEEALRQLYAASTLEGMRLVAGFPDLHPGKSSPIGAAFVTEDRIYPSLIGGDIGCGMSLFKTDLVRRDADLDRWAEIPFDLEHVWTDETDEVLARCELESTEFNDSLGTLGAGDHFAELQVVEEIVDPREFKKLGIGKQQLVVLVHSGSRGLGESVLRDCVGKHQEAGLDAESFAGAAYLRNHDLVVRWARVNRSLIARRFVEALGAEAEVVWDGCHNSITRGYDNGEVVWVHRKGAVATQGEPVMIPGSRGSFTYLVKPLGDGASRAWSLAHGAGRKWARSEARLRMRERYGKEQLVETLLGSRVICGDRDLLYEEAPAVYKSIESVIEDLVDAGLVSVIAIFRPLLTYKTRALRL